MVPCPWFRAAADLAAVRPDLDLGLHLTLRPSRLVSGGARWRWSQGG